MKSMVNLYLKNFLSELILLFLDEGGGRIFFFLFFYLFVFFKLSEK